MPAQMRHVQETLLPLEALTRCVNTLHLFAVLNFCEALLLQSLLLLLLKLASCSCLLKVNHPDQR